MPVALLILILIQEEKNSNKKGGRYSSLHTQGVSSTGFILHFVWGRTEHIGKSATSVHETVAVYY